MLEKAELDKFAYSRDVGINTSFLDYDLQLGDSTTINTLQFLNERAAERAERFDLNEKIGPYTTLQYLYIYSAIIALCIFMTISRSLLFFKVCMNASKGLHDQMFNKILKGVMRFFDTNPSGELPLLLYHQLLFTSNTAYCTYLQVVY